MADLDSMTKDELTAYAEEQGIEVASSWTKAEIMDAITGSQGDFVTPRITITAVTGRDQMSEEQMQALVDDVAGAGGADQGSLGGTGGTTVTGGEGGMGAGPP